VRVDAPGFRAFQTTIALESGTVRQAEVKLARAASGPMWTMNALRAARKPACVWAAARYYAQSPAAGLRFTRADLAALEQPARRGVESSAPRVAKLTLKDGTSTLGQIWNQPGFITVRSLPAGEKRTINLDEVVKTEDVPVERAARLLADALFTDGQNAGEPQEALQAVAVLMLQYGDQNGAAAELLPYVRRCVEQIEKACAGCCGGGLAPCPDCDARGSVSGEVDCAGCKGTRTMACLTCRGSGNEACRICGGTGETVVQVRTGAWVRDSYRKCSACVGRGKQRCTDCPSAQGKIECRRCKGTGKTTGKGECPTCTGERTIRCPACKGEKTRDDMQPEVRDLAEADALAAAQPQGP
jgi:hypothetical protein